MSEQPLTVGDLKENPKLKNKTLDDIIQMWNANLDTYSTDFKKYAIQIQQKDLQLLENSIQISNLFSDLESLTNLEKEISSNLDFIEAQQQELDTILDSYSSKLDFTPVSAADKDREQAYLVAEQLNAQLDDMQVLAPN